MQPFPEDFPVAARECFHRRLHPERYGPTHTICLDCGGHVIVTDAYFASGETPDAQRRRLWTELERQREARASALSELCAIRGDIQIKAESLTESDQRVMLDAIAGGPCPLSECDAADLHACAWLCYLGFVKLTGRLPGTSLAWEITDDGREAARIIRARTP